MTLPVLELLPDRAAYRATQRGRALRTRFDGSQGRYRRDYDGPAVVRAQWTIDEQDYDRLVHFYISVLKNGALPFSIDLIVEDGTPETQTARIVPDSFRLRSVAGKTFTLAADLEVL